MRPIMSKALRRLLREPLTYFVLVGGLLFLARPDDRGGRLDDTTIVITPAIVELLKTQYVANNKAQPTDAELDRVVDRFLEEEVLLRYARSLGLDENDAVVRRRLVQKARITIEDAEPLPDPDEYQLRDYYDRHAETYLRPARVSFRHVFLPRDDPATDDVRCEQIRSRLEQGADPATLGQPFALGHEKIAQTRDDVQRVFGESMADALLRVDTGIWVGPFRSRYGCHIARVDARQAAYVPPFEELRERVATDWRRAERERRNRAAYARLRERYEVLRLDSESAR
jgi:hypothetical protein